MKYLMNKMILIYIKEKKENTLQRHINLITTTIIIILIMNNSKKFQMNKICLNLFNNLDKTQNFNNRFDDRIIYNFLHNNFKFIIIFFFNFLNKLYFNNKIVYQILRRNILFKIYVYFLTNNNAKFIICSYLYYLNV